MQMREIEHTHPYTGEAFGNQYYDAGTVVTDGGREESDEDGEQRTETMADVDHDGSDGTVRSFQRGTGHEETVEHE